MIVALILSLIVPVFAEEPRIEIRPYNRISGKPEITLADLTAVPEKESATREALAGIVLGDAPGVGEQRVFTAAALSEAFRRGGAARGLRKLELRIPSRVVVENTGATMAESEIRERLETAWRRLCGECRFVIKSLSLPLLPDSVRGQHWSLREPNQLPKGSFSAAVEFASQYRKSELFWINGAVEVQRRVPVATRAMALGERFAEADIRYEYRDTSFALDSAPEANEIVGQRARQALRVGDIVWRQSLVREPALRRGEVVRLQAGEGPFEVSLMGLAEQDGHIGDRVRVKNRESNKILYGRVVERGEVRIE